MAANTNWKLPSVATTAISSVYPTEGGISTGLQGSLAGDAAFMDSNASFIASFNRMTSSGFNALVNPTPDPAGATGGKNSQRMPFTSANASSGQGPAQGADSSAAAAPGGFVASPITWIFVLAVLVGGIIFLAHKTGNKEEFANIRGSFYNIFYVSFVAIVGILILKAVFSRIQVPGLSKAFAAV